MTYLTQAQRDSAARNAHDFSVGAVVHNVRLANASELTEATLRRLAPSVFAESAAEDVSGRYLFLPTFDILRKIKESTGLVVVSATQQRTRERGDEFAKHELVMRMPGGIKEWRVGDTVMELRLTNSHDRSSAYSMDTGLYRFACNNGLMLPVSGSSSGSIRVKHMGDADVIDDVLEGCTRIIASAPEVQARLETMKAITYDRPEQIAFATAAATMRWGTDENGRLTAPVRPEQLLAPKRFADTGDDAWMVLNRVQEHLIKGGDGGRAKTGRRLTTRPVGSIDEGQRLNKALFTLHDALMKARSA